MCRPRGVLRASRASPSAWCRPLAGRVSGFARILRLMSRGGSSPVVGRANVQRLIFQEVDMPAVFTRAIALPLATLLFAVACSDGVGPTQPMGTPAEASAAKQGTTASRMLFYDFNNVWIMN